LELQNISVQALLHKIAAQTSQKEGTDAEIESLPKPQQQTQTQTQTQSSLFSASANSNPALLDILNNVLQSSKTAENIDVSNNSKIQNQSPNVVLTQNSSAESVDKFAVQAQTAIDKAAIFAKLSEEVLKQLDNLPLLPKEKEFTEAFLREIENIIRKNSPSSPIVQLAENLPKTASIEDIYKWVTTQIKNGNLPVRDLFALPQILLNKTNFAIEPTNYPSAQISTPVVYSSVNVAAPVADANLTSAPILISQSGQKAEIPLSILPDEISQNKQNQKIEISNSIPSVAISQSGQKTEILQNNPKADIAVSISPASPVEVLQNKQTTNFTLSSPVEKPNETTQNTNLSNMETPNVNPQNTKPIAETPNVNPQNIQKIDVAVSIPANVDFSQNNKTTNINNSIPNAAQNTISNPATIIETPNATTIIAVNSNPIQNAIPLAETPKIISVNNFSLSPQEPKEILFVQQTNANLKENIQNLIPQIQNESIKNLLNEIFAQILPEKDNAAFAFVKIDGKNDSFARFLPLALQTQFNSEFSSILSKNFPEFSKELLLDTANIIRNGEKPIIISQSVLKNVENILKSINSNGSAEPQNQNQTQTSQMPTAAAQWKITPAILSSLLQYAAEPNKNETILQNFKTVFTVEKGIENISSNMKNFVEHLENIFQKTAENSHKKPNLISQEFTKSVEKLNDLEKILKNAETIFKKENSIEYLMEKIGILQNKSREPREQQPKVEENLRNILKEISQQIKISSQKLQNLPDLQTADKFDDAFSKLKNLSNSVNELSRKIDAANLLANKVDISVGRSEQTVIVPVQIGNAWLQMEFRINKDDKNKNNKGKKQAEQVELNVELDKGNSVSAKANLTLEKQLQVSINFTNDKMLEWFKQNYKEFCEALESIGTKSVRVIFNREKCEEERREKNEIIKSNFDITG